MQKKSQRPVDEWQHPPEDARWDWESPMNVDELDEGITSDQANELRSLRGRRDKELPKTIGDEIFDMVGNLFLLFLVIGVIWLIFSLYKYSLIQIVAGILLVLLVANSASYGRRW